MASLTEQHSDGTVIRTLTAPGPVNGANFSKVKSTKLNLKEQQVSGINLSEATVRSADMRSADLSKANLAGADLSHSDVAGADLRNADLRGANLYQVANLATTKLTGALYNGETVFPQGFRPADAGMVFRA